MMNKTISLLLIIIFSLFTSLFQTQLVAKQHHSSNHQLTRTQWQQDVDKLLAKIIRLHPNPWRTISKNKFKSHLQAIVNNSGNESKQSTIIKLIKSVSMITQAGMDGHSGIWPIQKATDFHLLPLRLYWFSDGIYILEADEKNSGLIGHRITAIAGISIVNVLAKVQPYVSHENSMWLKSWTPFYATIPELLESLGIAKGLSVTITTEDSSRTKINTQVTAISAENYEKLFFQALNIAVLPVNASAPMYLQRVFEQRFWYKQLNENTLYLQYNLIFSEDNDGETFNDFMEKVEIEIKKYQLTNLIVDVRNNGGGDNTAYAPFFTMLNTFKSEKRDLDLYLLTGRVTFSAAINFTVDVDNKTPAIFLGEPTGGSPNQYGDPISISLVNSGLSVRIASRFWNKTLNRDKALSHQPDYLINLSSRDYFSGADPVLQKALDLIELKSFE